MQRMAIILMASLALVAGIFFSSRYFQPVLTPGESSGVATTDLTGTQRPDFRLGSSSGEFVSPADFPGKMLLINFWATWCGPCRKEMPLLMEIQDQYGSSGLQVIGIALDDLQPVRDFVQTLGIRYPILVGEADVMQTNQDYGNVTGMLPYTVLVDRKGFIRWQHMGEVRRQQVAQILSDL